MVDNMMWGRGDDHFERTCARYFQTTIKGKETYWPGFPEPNKVVEKSTQTLGCIRDIVKRVLDAAA